METFTKHTKAFLTCSLRFTLPVRLVIRKNNNKGSSYAPFFQNYLVFILSAVFTSPSLNWESCDRKRREERNDRESECTPPQLRFWLFKSQIMADGNRNS